MLNKLVTKIILMSPLLWDGHLFFLCFIPREHHKYLYTYPCSVNLNINHSYSLILKNVPTIWLPIVKKCFPSYTWLSTYQKMFLETLLVLQVVQAVVTVNKNFSNNLLPAVGLEYKKIRLCIAQKDTSLLVT